MEKQRKIIEKEHFIFKEVVGKFQLPYLERYEKIYSLSSELQSELEEILPQIPFICEVCVKTPAGETLTICSSYSKGCVMSSRIYNAIEINDGTNDTVLWRHNTGRGAMSKYWVYKKLKYSSGKLGIT